jgi:tetratricopeptide (TPR) repeat protein
MLTFGPCGVIIKMIEKRNVPPKQLPRTADADEYFLLSVQYMLIGSLRMSFKAALKAIKGHSAYGRRFLELYSARTGSNVTAYKLNRAQYALTVVGMTVLDLACSTIWPLIKFLWSSASGTTKFFGSLSSKFGKRHEEASTSSVSSEADTLTKSIARVALPAGLSADEYLQLGKQYKQNGWVSQSQAALKLAQEIGAGSDAAREAEIYLRTKVPHAQVSLELEAENIKGYHAVSAGNLKEAREIFEPMMVNYPEFEWSYLNLATAYMKDRQPDQAKYLLRKLLSINPDHVEGWDSLARVYASELDLDEAQSAVQRSTELLPADSATLKAIIDCLAELAMNR